MATPNPPDRPDFPHPPVSERRLKRPAMKGGEKGGGKGRKRRKRKGGRQEGAKEGR
jgi:hypothetical protein